MRLIWNAGAAASVSGLASLAALIASAPVYLPTGLTPRPFSAIPTSAVSTSPGTALLVAPDAVRDRFEAANSSRDGRLTLEQARRSGWVQVAVSFERIDLLHAGYVTEGQVRLYLLSHHRRGRSRDV